MRAGAGRRETIPWPCGSGCPGAGRRRPDDRGVGGSTPSSRAGHSKSVGKGAAKVSDQGRNRAGGNPARPPRRCGGPRKGSPHHAGGSDQKASTARRASGSRTPLLLCFLVCLVGVLSLFFACV